MQYAFHEADIETRLLGMKWLTYHRMSYQVWLAMSIRMCVGLISRGIQNAKYGFGQ